MFGFFTVVQQQPSHRVEEIGAAIKQVFVRLAFPFKHAASDMAMLPPHLSRGLNEHGISVTRLAMLPDKVKREIWLALAPHFGVTEVGVPEDVKHFERRLAELEASVQAMKPSTREDKQEVA